MFHAISQRLSTHFINKRESARYLLGKTAVCNAILGPKMYQIISWYGYPLSYLGTTKRWVFVFVLSLTYYFLTSLKSVIQKGFVDFCFAKFLSFPDMGLLFNSASNFI